MIFGYVIVVIITVMSIRVLRNQWFYNKLGPNLFNIAPIEQKLVLWAKGGEVNIPIKFEENLRTLEFY